jgi:hypothetical protein
VPRPTDVLEITVAEMQAAIRKAKREAYRKGEATAISFLKSVSKLNGSAAPLLKGLAPETPAEPDATDPHAALYEALLGAAIEAHEQGREDEIPGLVQAYRDHLDDPDTLAGAVREAGGPPEQLAKSLGWVLLKASWNKDLHPRDDHGRFVSKDAIQAAAKSPAKAAELRKRVTDPKQREKLDAAIEDQEGTVGRTKRGQAKHEAGQRREKKQADHRRAGELGDKVAGGSATFEELMELADHVEGLTVDKLRALQARIPTTGGRRKGEMVTALKESLWRSASFVGMKRPAPPDQGKLALAGFGPNRYKIADAGGNIIPAGEGYQRWEGGRNVGYSPEDAARIADSVTPDHADRRIQEHENAANSADLDEVQRDYHAEMAAQLRDHKERLFPPAGESSEPATAAANAAPLSGVRSMGNGFNVGVGSKVSVIFGNQVRGAEIVGVSRDGKRVTVRKLAYTPEQRQRMAETGDPGLYDEVVSPGYVIHPADQSKALLAMDEINRAATGGVSDLHRAGWVEQTDLPKTVTDPQLIRPTTTPPPAAPAAASPPPGAVDAPADGAGETDRQAAKRATLDRMRGNAPDPDEWQGPDRSKPSRAQKELERTHAGVVAGQEAWETQQREAPTMTASEYAAKYGGNSAGHKKLVQDALARGETVPDHVLVEYPDLHNDVIDERRASKTLRQHLADSKHSPDAMDQVLSSRLSATGKRIDATTGANLEGFAANTANRHRESVKRQLAAGKPVPPEVLADYPDLATPVAPNENEPAPAAGADNPHAADEAELDRLSRSPTKLSPQDAARRDQLRREWGERNLRARGATSVQVPFGGGKGPGVSDSENEATAAAAARKQSAPGADRPARADLDPAESRILDHAHDLHTASGGKPVSISDVRAKMAAEPGYDRAAFDAAILGLRKKRAADVGSASDRSAYTQDQLRDGVGAVGEQFVSLTPRHPNRDNVPETPGEEPRFPRGGKPAGPGADHHAGVAAKMAGSTLGLTALDDLRKDYGHLSDADWAAGVERLADAGKVTLYGDESDEKLAAKNVPPLSDGKRYSALTAKGDALTAADLEAAFGGGSGAKPAGGDQVPDAGKMVEPAATGGGNEPAGGAAGSATPRPEMDLIRDRNEIGQKMYHIASMSGAMGYVGIAPDYQDEYRQLNAQHDALRKEHDTHYAAPRREAQARADKERNDANWDKKAARVAALPVKERKNGWHIVDDGGQYHVRDPHTGESIYEGKLSRARQVAGESPPDKPADPPAQAPAATKPPASTPEAAASRIDLDVSPTPEGLAGHLAGLDDAGRAAVMAGYGLPATATHNDLHAAVTGGATYDAGRKPAGAAKPVKAPRATKPKPAAPAAKPAAHGTAGEGHPLGQTPDEQRRALGSAIGSFNGLGKLPPGGTDEDPLGHGAAGFPAGVDRGVFEQDVQGVVGRSQVARSVGASHDELYNSVGKKYELSQHEFARAMHALHDPDTADRLGLRGSGWSQSLDQLPAPGVATMRGQKVMNFLQTGTGSVADNERLAGMGDQSLNVDHPEVQKRFGGQKAATDSPASPAGDATPAPSAEAAELATLERIPFGKHTPAQRKRLADLRARGVGATPPPKVPAGGDPATAHAATLPPTSPARKAIEAAVANGGGDKRKTLKELGHRHAEMHAQMSPQEEAGYVEMMGRMGAKPLHAPGETKPFDPETMQSDAGISTGTPVKVARRGWTGLYGDAKTGHELIGNNYQRAQVEPANSPNSRQAVLDSTSRTGDTATVPATPAGGGGKPMTTTTDDPKAVLAERDRHAAAAKQSQTDRHAATMPPAVAFASDKQREFYEGVRRQATAAPDVGGSAIPSPKEKAAKLLSWYVAHQIPTPTDRAGVSKTIDLYKTPMDYARQNQAAIKPAWEKFWSVAGKDGGNLDAEFERRRAELPDAQRRATYSSPEAFEEFVLRPMFGLTGGK